ncbi:sigma factor-like helix-turn-helix DNA-binding protein [Caproiciproducens sp. CPB-2]|uniref:sigma factor-like helix-turn-helix DNA-binding protein n=1 Tax=Caproiciproducens sp. CPB-2 TaxID=3030017 RepID=UPI002E381E97|nr:sigma factor-like helix-turn-helix DNA-binding protein [Caproiciproducens sp. CPB-2]
MTKAIKAVMIEKMLTHLKHLSTEEQELISALFFKGKSERQVSREIGVPQRSIHGRKIRILEKLKKFMEK